MLLILLSTIKLICSMKKSVVNESDLINGIKNGNTKIIEMFYVEQFPIVHKYVNRNGGNPDDAKDVMQEAMLSFFVTLNKDDFKLRNSPGDYFFGISKNVWKKRIREIKVDNQLKLDLLLNPDINESGVDKNQEEYIRVLLFRKLTLLKKECRDFISMYLQKIPNRKIAENLNINSEVTVRVKKKHCLDRLLSLIRSDDNFKLMNDER